MKKKKLVVGEAVWVQPSEKKALASTTTRTARSSPAPVPAVARKGKVQRLRSSGAIDIYYENGEVEEAVGNDRISTTKTAASKPKSQLVIETTPRETEASTSIEEPQAALFSPSASTAPVQATRRAKTADASQSASRGALRTTPQSAGAARGSSTSKYVDMSEALAENQQKVLELLETIRSKREDATSVVRELVLVIPIKVMELIVDRSLMV